MMFCRTIVRTLQNTHLNKNAIKCSIVELSSSSSSDSDSDKRKKKSQKQGKTTKAVGANKSSEALKKLNLLLKQMVETETKDSTKVNLDLAKPKPELRKKPKLEASTEPVENQLVKAVKGVAETIGGNVKQTESELLTKLLNPVKQESQTEQKSSLNLNDLIIGMKIDRSPKSTPSKEISRAHQVRQLLERGASKGTQRSQEAVRKPAGPRNISKLNAKSIDLFGSDPLNIFETTERKTDEIVLKTWNTLHQRELRLAVTHPPENYFQEMILWTEQGKLWKFPIDNEQGMEVEQSVSFSDHIFLEKYLQPWCPNKGPIRHFMELVCVGLSKNPYLTAQAKKEHIEWFQDYFMSKKELLTEIGAIPAESTEKVTM